MACAVSRVRTVTPIALPEIALVGRAAEPRARPVRTQATGRAVRDLARTFGLGSTMHRAGTRRSRATDRYYNHSAEQSITLVNDCQSRFPDFWRSIEGHVWRGEQATTPLLVSLHPSASSAFNVL